jgi:hypothetical protein
MANGISSSQKAPIELKQVSGKIATVAQSQSAEKLNQAIHSFGWVQQNEETFFQTFDKKSIPDAAFIDSPSNYFNRPEILQTRFSETAPIDQIANKLKQRDLNYQKGVKAFLKCGMEEALAGLKLKDATPTRSLPSIPTALDELLTPQKLKNPDQINLQASISTVKTMFSNLKRLQQDTSHLQLNMTRFVRA